MKLSIVDLGTVSPGTTGKEALADSLEGVRHAEAAGFHRVWFAEHHLSRSGASHHPELLIAAAAAQTSDIRLGSGAVLMNHYSPFKVAEMFKQLEAMAPGRIDLGMGRATAGPPPGRCWTWRCSRTESTPLRLTISSRCWRRSPGCTARSPRTTRLPALPVLECVDPCLELSGVDE